MEPTSRRIPKRGKYKIHGNKHIDKSKNKTKNKTVEHRRMEN